MFQLLLRCAFSLEAFEKVLAFMARFLLGCRARGFYAAALDLSSCVPVLQRGLQHWNQAEAIAVSNVALATYPI